MFELTVLHVFHKWQVELGHIVFVHVEKYVSNHHDALFDFLPNAVEFFQKLLIVVHFNFFCDGLEQLHSGVLDTVVEHLTMLVEH